MRWLAHERFVKRLLQIYPSLLLCLEEIRDEWGQEAAGLLSALRSRNTLKALMVLDVVFGILGTMSRVFQGKQCDAVAAMALIIHCIPMLSNINIHSVINEGISELTGRCTEVGVEIPFIDEEETIGRRISTQQWYQDPEASLNPSMSIDHEQPHERIIYSLKEYISVVVKKLEERFSDNTNAVINAHRCFAVNGDWEQSHFRSLAASMPGGTIDVISFNKNIASWPAGLIDQDQ